MVATPDFLTGKDGGPDLKGTGSGYEIGAVLSTGIESGSDFIPPWRFTKERLGAGDRNSRHRHFAFKSYRHVPVPHHLKQ